MTKTNTSLQNAREEALRETRQSFTDNGYKFDPGSFRAGWNARDAFDAGAAYADRWTYTSERLPDDNQPCLISDGKWTDVGFREDGDWYWATEPDQHAEVIAWQNLPAPARKPEPKENDGK